MLQTSWHLIPQKWHIHPEEVWQRSLIPTHSQFSPLSQILVGCYLSYQHPLTFHIYIAFFPNEFGVYRHQSRCFPSRCGPCYTRGWSAKAGRPNMAMLVGLYIVSGYFLGKREPVNSSHRDHLNLKTRSISHLALLMIILSPSSTLTFLDLHFGLLDFWAGSAYNQLEQTDIYKEPCIHLLMFIHYLSSILLLFPGIT